MVVLTIAKRLDLLAEMVPMANPIGVLVNPNNPSAESNPKDAQTAAETLGRKLIVVKAGTEDEIDTAFATLVREKVGAVLVDADRFFWRDESKFSHGQRRRHCRPSTRFASSRLAAVL